MNHSIFAIPLLTSLTLSALEMTELQSFRLFPSCADRAAWEKAARSGHSAK